jgi:hypothetical protein
MASSSRPGNKNIFFGDAHDRVCPVQGRKTGVPSGGTAGGAMRRPTLTFRRGNNGKESKNVWSQGGENVFGRVSPFNRGSLGVYWMLLSFPNEIFVKDAPAIR